MILSKKEINQGLIAVKFRESDIALIKKHITVLVDRATTEESMKLMGQNWHSDGDSAVSVFSFKQLSSKTKEEIGHNYAERQKNESFTFCKNSNFPDTISDECIIQIGWDPEWGERAALFLNEQDVEKQNSFYDFIIEDKKIASLWAEIK